MRLIDRDLLLSEIEKSRGKNPHKDSKIRANHTIEHDHIAHLVLEQPTAYDVDKVVGQLKVAFERTVAEILDRTDSEFTIADFNIGKYTERLEEIVRTGGVE